MCVVHRAQQCCCSLLVTCCLQANDNDLESEVGLEARKYTKTHKRTGSDKHSKNKHSDTHKPSSPGKQDAPYAPPPDRENAYPAPDNTYQAPGDSYTSWRKHDAEQKHEYKTGGGGREHEEPWGEYAPREAYGELV